MHRFAQRTSSNFKTRQLANARSHRPKRSGNEQFGLRPVDWIQKRARVPAPEAPARRRTRRIFAGAAFFRIFNALTGARRATARTRRRGGARRSPTTPLAATSNGGALETQWLRGASPLLPKTVRRQPDNAGCDASRNAQNRPQIEQRNPQSLSTTLTKPSIKTPNVLDRSCVSFRLLFEDENLFLFACLIFLSLFVFNFIFS